MSLATFGQAIIKSVVNNKYKILNKITNLTLSKFNFNQEIGNKISSTINTGNINPASINELNTQIKSYVEKEIQSAQVGSKSFCPSKSELLKLINVRNELIKTLTTVKKQTLLLNNTTQPIEPILSALETAVTLLKLAPIPIPPGTPIGVITTAGDSLAIAKEKISMFKTNIQALNVIKEYINTTIDQVLNVLKLLDTLIELCAEKISKDETASTSSTATGIGGEGGTLAPGSRTGVSTGIGTGNVGGTGENNLLLNNLLNIEDSGLIDQLQASTSNDTNTYKGFKLEVLLDDKNDTRFPKRYAVAKTPNGVVVLRGESSFASSVNVLLDEIKFIIDRDNLKI